MSRGKAEAYKAGVKRAYSKAEDVAEKQKLLKEPYSETDGRFLKCQDQVLGVLNKLPGGKTVNFETFAFMLGVSPRTLTNDGPKIPAPIGSVMKRVNTVGGGNTTKKTVTRRWRIDQVKQYKAEREERLEKLLDSRSKDVVERRRGKIRISKEELATLTALIDQQPIPLQRILNRFTKMTVSADGRIHGFVGLHSMSDEDLNSVFRSGGQIESMSLHEALMERPWVNHPAKKPWTDGYLAQLEHEKAVAQKGDADDQADTMGGNLKRGLPQDFKRM